jgi:MFS family permease
MVAIASSITAATALFTTYLWGRVADRWGHKVVLSVGTFLVGLLLPSGWILAGITGVTAWIWATAVFEAVSWGAARPAAFNLALISAPRATGPPSSPCTASAAGVAGFAGGALAGPAAGVPAGLRDAGVRDHLDRLPLAVHGGRGAADAGVALAAVGARDRPRTPRRAAGPRAAPRRGSPGRGSGGAAGREPRPGASARAVAAAQPAGVSRCVTATSCGSVGSRSTTSSSSVTPPAGRPAGSVGSSRS